jgi:hypothetical protein
MPTLPTSGPLSLLDIQTAFGGSDPIGTNEYYAGGRYVETGQLGYPGGISTLIPSSGPISIADFYGSTPVVPGNSGIISTISTVTGIISYTLPLSAGTHIKILAVGGGGGGGGGSGRTALDHNPRGSGSGGGSGAVAYTSTIVSPGQTLTITVGGGGTGGLPCDGGYSPGTEGGNGGDTYVSANGSILIYSAGGHGGTQGYDYSIGELVPGGLQGAVMTGTNTALGSAGGPAQWGGGIPGGGFGGYGVSINSAPSTSTVVLNNSTGTGGIGNDPGGAPGVQGTTATSGLIYGGGGGGGGANNEFFYEYPSDSASVGSPGAVFIWWGY